MQTWLKQLRYPLEVERLIDVALQVLEPNAHDGVRQILRADGGLELRQHLLRGAAGAVDGQVEHRPGRQRMADDEPLRAGAGREVDLQDGLVAVEVAEVEPLQRTRIDGVDLRDLEAVQMSQRDVVE